MDLSDNLKILNLFDIYGNLLTDKQRECLTDYLINNLTLTEISEIYGISRQAVNFNIKESIKLLEGYENKLHLSFKIDKIESALSDLGLTNSNISDIINLLKE